MRMLVMRLQNVLRRHLGLEVHRYRREPPGCNVLPLAISDILLRRLVAGQQPSEFTFLQIGANDGVTGDPIHPFITRYGWRGVCVEPQPEAFRRLQATYREYPAVHCVQAAIGATDGEATLYRFRPGPHLPPGADMLASFSRDLLVANTHGVRGEVEALSVPALSFTTLLDRYHIATVDLLQIDAEGYDAAILRLRPPSLRPLLINFEAAALAYPEQQACFNALRREGYTLTWNGVDVVAYLEPPEQVLLPDDWH
jgi:FkbM family methyltransferase